MFANSLSSTARCHVTVPPFPFLASSPLLCSPLLLSSHPLSSQFSLFLSSPLCFCFLSSSSFFFFLFLVQHLLIFHFFTFTLSTPPLFVVAQQLHVAKVGTIFLTQGPDTNSTITPFSVIPRFFQPSLAHLPLFVQQASISP